MCERPERSVAKSKDAKQSLFRGDSSPFGDCFVLVGRAQAGLAAATAREREATQLYELSTALAGLRNDHIIT